MLGIPVRETSFLFVENKSVLDNTTVPGSMIKKKMNRLSYHFTRKGYTRDEWRIAYVNTLLNCADLLTKSLPLGEKRSSLVRKFLHWIYDGKKMD